MTDHSVFDRQRQRAVLRKLTRNAGLEATDLAQAVGLSYPQLLRYIYGKVPLRTYQIPVFAKAFGVDPLDLAAEIGGQDILEDQLADPDKPVWSFRAALRGHLPDWLIDKLAPKWEGRPILNQQAAAEALIDDWRERIEEATLKPRDHANAG